MREIPNQEKFSGGHEVFPGNPSCDPVSDRLAVRLTELRRDRGWSLDELALRSGVSRASLSRLEHGDVSPTAQVLGRLCATYGITMSRLLAEVETTQAALLRPADQPVWRDPQTGFVRRSLSPPARQFAAELVQGELPGGTVLEYPGPARIGLEHHLYLTHGRLELTVDGVVHTLAPGDCLRYRLHGASRFRALGKASARYLLVMI